MSNAMQAVIWFEELRRSDIGKVGGKNSSLGEMIQTLSQKGSACQQASRRRQMHIGTTSTPMTCGSRSLRSSPIGRKARPALPKPAPQSGSFSCRAIGRRKRRMPSSLPMAHYPAAPGATMSPSRFDPALRPRISPTRASRASRKPSSTSRAKRRCSTPAVAVMHRCSRTGRSPIGRRRVSTI